jgi:hypothetical protein
MKISLPGFFTQIRPVWIDELETSQKNNGWCAAEAIFGGPTENSHRLKS